MFKISQSRTHSDALHWDYQRQDGRVFPVTKRILPTLVVAVSLAGAAVSAYLLRYKIGGGPILCLNGSGCADVNASTYSMILGLPVSLLGLITYLGLTAAGLLWRKRGEDLPEWVMLSAFGISLVGFLYSAYLTWVEAFVIHAYCTWCLTSFALITVDLALWTTGLVRRD